jgi:hypothetical protein
MVYFARRLLHSVVNLATKLTIVAKSDKCAKTKCTQYPAWTNGAIVQWIKRFDVFREGSGSKDSNTNHYPGVLIPPKQS